MNIDIRELFYELARANKEVERIRTDIKDRQESCIHNWVFKNLEYDSITCSECLASKDNE